MSEKSRGHAKPSSRVSDRSSTKNPPAKHPPKDSLTKDRLSEIRDDLSAKKDAGSENLPDDELAAWDGLVAVTSRLTGRLDADLVAGHNLPLVEFQVLARLEAAAGPIRMSDLAAASSLSRSGLTRVVDVLAEQGLVTRSTDSTDGRVVRATISEAGRGRLATASGTRAATLASFFAPLSPKQTRALGKAWAALLERSVPPVS